MNKTQGRVLRNPRVTLMASDVLGDLTYEITAFVEFNGEDSSMSIARSRNFIVIIYGVHATL